MATLDNSTLELACKLAASDILDAFINSTVSGHHVTGNEIAAIIFRHMREQKEL